MADSALMKPREVAEVFDVSVETVNRWADDKKLPGVRLPSGRWRFRRSDVEALLSGERAG